MGSAPELRKSKEHDRAQAAAAGSRTDVLAVGLVPLKGVAFLEA